MTRFQILYRTNAEDWNEGATIEAHSAKAAVTAAYMKAQSVNILAMVAVPARSWKPTPIRTETVMKVVLGGTTEQQTVAKTEPAA